MVLAQLERFVESRLIVWPDAWMVVRPAGWVLEPTDKVALSGRTKLTRFALQPLAESGVEAADERKVLYRLRYVAILPAILSVLWVALLADAGWLPTRFGSLISSAACTALCLGLSTRKANQSYTMVTKAVFLATILVIASLSQLPLAAVSYTQTCPSSASSSMQIRLSAKCTGLALDNVMMSANCFIFGFFYIIVRRIETGLLLRMLAGPRDDAFMMSDGKVHPAPPPRAKKAALLTAEVAEVLSGAETDEEVVLGIEERVAR